MLHSTLVILISALFLYQNSFSQEVNQSEQIDLLLLKENYTAAIQELEIIIQEDSTSAEAYHKLGLAYQGIYRNDKAQKAFLKAHQLDSCNVGITLALGKCYYNTGMVIQAKQIFIGVYSKDSTNVNAAMNLAKIYSEQSNYKEAFKIYHNLVLADSPNPYLLKQLGYCTMKIDSLILSLSYYQKALIINPGDAYAAVQISTICYSLNRLDSALQFVNTGLNILPEEPNFNRLKAEIFYKKKHYCNARDFYLKTLSVGDSSAATYFKLGYTYYQIAKNPDSTVTSIEAQKENFQNYYRALEDIEKAISKEKENPIYCYQAGIVADKITATEKAIFYFAEAEKYSFPNYSADLYRYLGCNYQLRQRYEEAIEAYKKSLFYNPNDMELTFMIGNIYEYNLKDEENGEKYLVEFFTKMKDGEGVSAAYAKKYLDQVKKKRGTKTK